ncbi:Lrp/AsnC family transcriptional regulator [Chloroflexota bacterium]
MDLLDQELIKLLSQDAAQSNQIIAKKLKVTTATIRRRKWQLIKNGALRILGAVNPVKIGYGVTVVVTFDVEGGRLDSAIKLLSSRPEITWVSTTTGRFDIIALVRLQSTDELSQFISDTVSSIEGLRNSETFVCLSVAKGKFSLMFSDSK